MIYVIRLSLKIIKPFANLTRIFVGYKQKITEEIVNEKELEPFDS
jgi:hypothetical protein